MLGPLQGADEIVVAVPAKDVFRVIEDSTRLPDWTAVLTTTGGREAVGSVRECVVNLQGRQGTVVERCIESVPFEHIAWSMEKDTFGFSRMLADFGFSFTLEAVAPERTLVRSETYYRPAGPIAALTNALVMRRKFGAIRRQWLGNLKRLCERTAAV